MNIILATGGTGGHIFPAIALARALKIRGYNVILFSDKKTNGVANLASYFLPLCKPSSGKLKFLLFMLKSCILAINKVRKLKPKLVIGFGSYASFPTLFAAKILSKSIVLHEQNILLGRVNRSFLKSAKLVMTSFPKTEYIKDSKFFFVGNFVNIKPQEYSCTKGSINILIIAGSQGSDFFDNVISDIACSLPFRVRKKIKIIQQCKEGNIDAIKRLYKSKKVTYEVSKFFDDIATRLINTDLVISRAGATSIAEITIAKRPAIYVPCPYSRDNHQLYNAKYIENIRAAVVVEQNSKFKEKLRELLIDLLQNRQKLYKMAANTRKAKLKSGVSKAIKLIAQAVI